MNKNFVSKQFMILATTISTALSVGVSWGINANRLTALEQKAAVATKDHDLLITIDTKLNMLLQRRGNENFK